MTLCPTEHALFAACILATKLDDDAGYERARDKWLEHRRTCEVCKEEIRKMFERNRDGMGS